jgi:periplasmic divalent cation tolerance protein
MFIAWTTVETRSAADELAAATVGLGLAACVQIDGPVTSHYRWQGKIEQASEFRLSFKCPMDRIAELESYVLNHHPYETPEWISVRADRVGEKYLSWARANSTNPPL